MPRYRIQTFKNIGGGKEWSNSYWVQAVDLDEAQGFGSTIINAEGSIHRANVNFVRYRVSTAMPEDGVFVTVPVNFAGGLAIASGQLPLWDTVRVDFAVFGGRPSYKFLRLPLEELDQQDGVLTSFFANQVKTFYADVLGTITVGGVVTSGLTDESGQAFVGITVHPRVQMRQTFRRRARRNAGGLGTS